MPTIQVAHDYIVPLGASLVFTNENAFAGTSGFALTIDIAGSVSVTGSVPNSGFAGPVLTVAGTTLNLVIEATGVAEVSSSGPAYGQVDIGTLTNNGLLEVTGSNATATESTWITNNGTIKATGISDRAIGLFSWNGQHVVNNGLVEVHGRGASISATGVDLNGSVGSFLNTGTVIAIRDSGGPSVAVYFNAGPFSSFTNHGTLQGDYALQASGTDYVSNLFTNTGVMKGAVDLSSQPDQFINSGSVQGSINLESGDDVYDGHLGTATGMVSGGDGNDSLAGGAGFDNFNGNKGDDTLDGGSGGGDWLVGGQGNDSIVSHASNDILYGNLGNDTLTGGSGDEIIRGGQGDDSLSGGAGNDWISGDRGNDTMSGGPGADTFHTFLGAGTDVVTDFNASEGDRVQVDAGTNYTLSQQGADVVIDMGNGDELILRNVQLSSLPANWIFTA